MCLYCSERICAHIVSVEQGEDWSPGVSAYVMGGALHVEVDADDNYYFAAPVNYCPMCGRELGGDAS